MYYAIKKNVSLQNDGGILYANESENISATSKRILLVELVLRKISQKYRSRRQQVEIEIARDISASLTILHH